MITKHRNDDKNDPNPTWIVTVPETYGDKEINLLIKRIFKLPDQVVGHVLAIREGISIDLPPFIRE